MSMRIDNYNYNHNLKSVTYYVDCYDRTLGIVWVDDGKYSNFSIYCMLDDAYDRWVHVDENPDVECYCCEEYMLECLPEDFKKMIECVIYGGEDE